MNRLWWGLMGVALLATQSGCRNSCGERRFQLFNRSQSDSADCRLVSQANNPCPVPTGALASQWNYPIPGYEGVPVVPGPAPSPGSSEPPNIPPTYLPATPVPAVPSAKNVLPPPKELAAPTGVVGYGK